MFNFEICVKSRASLMGAKVQGLSLIIGLVDPRHWVPMQERGCEGSVGESVRASLYFWCKDMCLGGSK